MRKFLYLNVRAARGLSGASLRIANVQYDCFHYSEIERSVARAEWGRERECRETRYSKSLDGVSSETTETFNDSAPKAKNSFARASARLWDRSGYTMGSDSRNSDSRFNNDADSLLQR